MQYRMLVLDVDGTLLDTSHHLPPDNLRALRKYQRLGGTVVLATGKLYHSIGDLCRTLRLQTPQIIGNGHVLVSPNGDVVECMGYLNPEQLTTARSVFDRVGLDYVFYGIRDIWYERGRVRVSDLEKLVSLGEVKPTPLPPRQVERLVEVIKLLAFCEDAEKEEEAKRLLKDQHDIHLYRSSYQFVEIARTDVDKGLGLRKLIEKMKVDPSEVAVIGDSENDVAMFSVAGLSVAMGQSAPAVRQRADVVTLSSDECGVARFLEEHILGD